MQPEEILEVLQQDGIVLLPDFIPEPQLAGMRNAFQQRLRHHSFNTWRGYEQNEKWRRLVEDVLILDAGFVQTALDDRIITVLDRYLGSDYCLTEARGWETIATRRSFHGWHNDAWYDTNLSDIPREIKLGVYLTDVDSGHMAYLQGSHKHGHRPGHWSDREVREMQGNILAVKGKAGTCFLFDTCGVHRQTSPVIEPRWAVMFNYHDPSIPIQSLDIGYGRYQPLMLNPAFLGQLCEKEKRILGFGNTALLEQQETGELKRRFPHLHNWIDATLQRRLQIQDLYSQLNRIMQGIRRRLPGNAASREVPKNRPANGG